MTVCLTTYDQVCVDAARQPSRNILPRGLDTLSHETKIPVRVFVFLQLQFETNLYFWRPSRILSFFLSSIMCPFRRWWMLGHPHRSTLFSTFWCRYIAMQCMSSITCSQFRNHGSSFRNIDDNHHSTSSVFRYECLLELRKGVGQFSCNAVPHTFSPHTSGHYIKGLFLLSIYSQAWDINIYDRGHEYAGEECTLRGWYQSNFGKISYLGVLRSAENDNIVKNILNSVTQDCESPNWVNFEKLSNFVKFHIWGFRKLAEFDSK